MKCSWIGIIGLTLSVIIGCGEISAEGCPEGEKRCSGDVVQQCADGIWTDWDSCGTRGMTCQLVEGATCVGTGDGDSDTDTDTDSDTDPDSDTDADSDTDSDTDTDTDSDSDTDTDSDADVVIDLNTPYTVHEGGYVVSQPWHGYAWTTATGTGSNISPVDFSVVTDDETLCINGAVGPMLDYSGVAMLGVNLNQAPGTDTATGTVIPTGTGFYVDVTNTGGSALRLQIQGPDGAVDANDRWCVNLVNGVQTIAFSSLNTMCWDMTGASYTGQPLEAAVLLVPGDDLLTTSYNVCLNELSSYSGTIDTVSWTCDTAFYGTGDGCDCGCGVLDPDCNDATDWSCDYSNCPDGSYPSPYNNAICEYY